MTRSLCKLATFALWMLAAPLPAFATVMFTFDQANQTVTLPTSGTVTVTFSGTLTADAGDIVLVATVFNPFDAAGDTLSPTFTGTPFILGDAARFTFTVNSATPLGLYEFAFDLANPSTFFYNYNDATGAPHTTVPVAFSLDIVAGTVPEPATVALLGIGLAGIGFGRRRRLH